MNKHRQEGSCPKTVPPVHQGSWIRREISPEHKRQIKELFIPIIIIVVIIITKLRQNYYKLPQLL